MGLPGLRLPTGFTQRDHRKGMGGREAGVPTPPAPPVASVGWLSHVPVGGSSPPLPALRNQGPPYTSSRTGKSRHTGLDLYIAPCPHVPRGPFLKLSPNYPDGMFSQSPCRPLTKRLTVRPHALGLDGPEGGQAPPHPRPGYHHLPGWRRAPGTTQALIKYLFNERMINDFYVNFVHILNQML